MRYGAGGAGGGVPRPPPVPNVSPFGSTTRLRRPMGAPFLTGCRVTVTSSPNLNDVRAQPSRVMSVGLLTSTAQLRTSPVSSFASNFKKQCGLAQIHSVTLPLSVYSFVVSKLAAPWCAATDTPKRTMTARKTVKNVCFKKAALRPHTIGRAPADGKYKVQRSKFKVS